MVCIDARCAGAGQRQLGGAWIGDLTFEKEALQAQRSLSLSLSLRKALGRKPRGFLLGRDDPLDRPMERFGQERSKDESAERDGRPYRGEIVK